MTNADETQEHEPDWTLARLVVLSEDETATQLAEAVGLPPDEAWNRGEPKKTPGLRYKISGITYRSRVPRTAEPAAHLDDLLARLTPVKDRIAALSARLAAQGGRPDSVRVWVTQFTSNASPGYDFSPRQLACISEMGAWLGLSIDVCADDDPGDGAAAELEIGASAT